MPIFDPLHCVPTITIVWVIICYNGYMLLLKHVACSPDEAWTFFGYSSSKNIKCQVQNCLHGKTRFLITMLDFNFALFYHEIWFKCIIHFICIFHVNILALGVILYTISILFTSKIICQWYKSFDDEIMQSIFFYVRYDYCWVVI